MNMLKPSTDSTKDPQNGKPSLQSPSLTHDEEPNDSP
jgi:hypothetical protein